MDRVHGSFLRSSRNELRLISSRYLNLRRSLCLIGLMLPYPWLNHTLWGTVTHDKKLVAQWIYRASELGSLKAAAWYPRICSANDIAPIRSSHLQDVFDFEGNLDDLTSDAYLSNRIQLQNIIVIKHIKTTVLAQNGLLSFDPSKYISKFGLFNDRMLDDLSPLHVASLLGDDVSVSKLLSHQKEELSSSQKLTSIHYACIGGHLSTLQLLLRHSSVSNAANPRGITLLHLCVFFVGDDARKAASLLLKNGNDPTAKILEPISWDYHDIYLEGTALDWATRTRHRSLVHSLLPFAQDGSCLRIAVGNFFWDIAEVILQDSPEIANVPVNYAQKVSELNDELQINHTENAKQMQDDIEFKETLLAKQAKRASVQDQTTQDLEYTVTRIRNLPRSMQIDLEAMRTRSSSLQTMMQTKMPENYLSSLPTTSITLGLS